MLASGHEGRINDRVGRAGRHGVVYQQHECLWRNCKLNQKSTVDRKLRQQIIGFSKMQAFSGPWRRPIVHLH